MEYIFTEDEFVTLVALAGIKSLYSFELNRDQKDTHIISSVHSLYKSGFAEEKEGRMVPSRELSEILKVMTTADHAVKISVPVEARPIRLIYCAQGNEVVVLERCLSEVENILKLEKIPVNELIYDLIQNEISDYISHDKDNDNELIERMRELELEEDDTIETVFKLERCNITTGRTTSVTSLNTTAVFARIVTEAGDDIKNELYTDEKLEQLLFEILGRK